MTTAESSPGAHPRLTVILLAENVATGIQDTIRRALALGDSVAVIVVDDASTDATADNVRIMDDSRVTLISQPITLGIGASLRRVINMAKGESVLVHAAELALTDQQYAALLEPITTGEADVACGAEAAKYFQKSLSKISFAGVAIGQRKGAQRRHLVESLTLAMRGTVAADLELTHDGPVVIIQIGQRLRQENFKVCAVALGVIAHSDTTSRWRGTWGSVVGALLPRSGHLSDSLKRELAQFDSADTALSNTLTELDAATPKYADWITRMIEPQLGELILEVGAGHGTMTARLAGDSRSVVATDLSARCCNVLRDRYVGNARINVFEGGIPEASATTKFDSAVVINVLEHVPNHVEMLTELRESVVPGGRVIIFVPAFEGLYSEFDRRIGHYRRYRRSDLVNVLGQADLELVDMRYVNFIGAFAWWLIVRKLRRAPTAGGSAGLYDRMVVPIVSRLERRVTIPFGQSLLCVAKR